MVLPSLYRLLKIILWWTVSTRPARSVPTNCLSYWRSFETRLCAAPVQHLWPSTKCPGCDSYISTQIAAGHRQIQLGALSPTRDFNFVADTCSAFAAVAACDQALGQVVNAASNFEFLSVTAALIAEVMNADVEISTDQQRLRPDGSEVNRLYGDNTRLLQLTGCNLTTAA